MLEKLIKNKLGFQYGALQIDKQSGIRSGIGKTETSRNNSYKNIRRRDFDLDLDQDKNKNKNDKIMKVQHQEKLHHKSLLHQDRLKQKRDIDLNSKSIQVDLPKININNDNSKTLVPILLHDQKSPSRAIAYSSSAENLSLKNIKLKPLKQQIKSPKQQIKSLNSALHSSRRKTKYTINIAYTHYPVIEKVAKQLNFKILTLNMPNIKKWDIKWCDSAISPETLMKMNQNQKINHFPGMSTIARKNQLVQNILRMKLKFPKQYNFTPKTFLMPKDRQKLCKYDQQARKKGLLKTYIVKPEADCQGRGIYLTQNIEQIHLNKNCVVQKYIINPLLYKGLKFDLRIYALVTSCSPLEIYIYHQGLVRFATEKYQYPSSQNLSNFCMHLTNYAINKQNPNYVFNESLYDLTYGHKKSLAQFFRELKSIKIPIQKYWSQIKDCIVKTLISGASHLKKQYKIGKSKDSASKMCFQILGFDFMIDNNGNVYLLEVNHTPALTTDTPLDELIKSNLVRDTLKIITSQSLEKVKDTEKKDNKQLGSFTLIFKEKKRTSDNDYGILKQGKGKLIKARNYENMLVHSNYESKFSNNNYQIQFKLESQDDISKNDNESISHDDYSQVNTHSSDEVCQKQRWQSDNFKSDLRSSNINSNIKNSQEQFPPLPPLVSNKNQINSVSLNPIINSAATAVTVNNLCRNGLRVGVINEKQIYQQKETFIDNDLYWLAIKEKTYKYKYSDRNNKKLLSSFVNQ